MAKLTPEQRRHLTPFVFDTLMGAILAVRDVFLDQEGVDEVSANTEAFSACLALLLEVVERQQGPEGVVALVQKLVDTKPTPPAN